MKKLINLNKNTFQDLWILKILSKYKYNFLFFFFKTFFYLKLDFIASMVFILSIKELKELNKGDSHTKILVFFKTGGIEDLKTTFSKQRNNNFQFYYIQRRFFRVLFNYYFNDTDLGDYNYIISDEKLKIKLKKYNNRLRKYIKFINRFYSFRAFISFNPFYKADREIQKVCSILNIKFLAFHKECVNSPLESKIFGYLYKNKVEKYMGSSISVYSEQEKKLIVKSKFAKKNQVTVTGSPRCDISFSYRKIKPEEKTIVYYMIEAERGAPWYLLNFLSKKKKYELIHQFGYHKSVLKVNWQQLANKTLNYCIKFAKKNKKIKLIIKGKKISHLRNHLPKNLPKNITFLNEGAGHHLLKRAKIIIGFNTTAVLEGILANRYIIIPYFNINRLGKNKDCILNFNTKKYAVQSEEKFYKKLNYFINKKYNFKELKNNEKIILRKFLGNSDGSSSKRLSNFLKQEM